MHIIIRWGLILVCLIAAGALAAMTHAPPNLAKALEVQQQLVTERPNDPQVYNDLGNLLLLDQRVEEAELAYERAVELDSTRPTPHFNLALLYQRRGDTEQALETFQKVIELEPRYAWAHFQIGSILERQSGAKDEAVEAYGRAFALDPDLADSKVNPQVIESRLVIEAMLRGFEQRAARPLAPYAYDDPARIAGLLVAAEELSSGPSEAAADGEGVNDEQVEQGSGGAAASEASALRPEPTWSGSEEEEPEAEAELVPTSSSSGGTEATPQVTTTAVAAGAAVVNEDRQDQESAQRYRAREGSQVGGTAADQDADRPASSRRPGFRPRSQSTNRSTGSLQWQLKPATESPFRAPAQAPAEQVQPG
ncbi:MAG: tetratricopeptide repeat protein [Acidobacteriota bacterium]